MILARTIKGKGVVVRRRQGRLARQGVQEGRGAGSRDRRAREAVASPDGAPANLASTIPKPAAIAAAGRSAEADRAARLQAGRAGRDARGVRHRARQARRCRRARRRARRRREELDLQRQVREGASRSLLSELHRRAGDGRRGDGAGGARRDSVPVDLRLLPDARRRFHPHGGDQQRRHQAGRLARRRVDRRGRAVADGARGSGDVPRRAELSPCCIRATRSAPSGWSRWRRISRARPTSARAGRRRRSSTRTTRRSRSAG